MYPSHPASDTRQAADYRRRRDFHPGGSLREDSRGRFARRGVDWDDLRRAWHRPQHQSRTVAVARTRRIWQHCGSGRNGMKDQPKLWSHAWPLMWSQRRDAVAGLVLSLVGIAASLLQPWPLQIIVDDILGAKPMPGWLPADRPVALLAVCLGLLAIHLLRGGLSA